MRTSVVGNEGALPGLGRELVRHRRRALRAWRNYQAVDEEHNPVASAAAHQAWSSAVDDTLKVAEQISREQASNLAELRIQFEAIWWWLIEDDSVLDDGATRWLGRYRRSLQRLARET